MGFKGITIDTAPEASAHIMAADDASIYDGAFGGDCVLDKGNKLSASIITNNLVRLSDGVISVQGHMGRIPYGEYFDATIENGTAGLKRYDIIVARFSTSGGVDTFELSVVKGTASASPADPTLTTGNLYQGAALREAALWRVKLDGLTITAVEQMFDILCDAKTSRAKKPVYVTKAATNTTDFTVTFPSDVKAFSLDATWDGKKIYNHGKYSSDGQNSVTNFNDTGIYTFNSNRVAILYLDTNNYVAFECLSLVNGVATIKQSIEGTVSGDIRLYFTPC